MAIRYNPVVKNGKFQCSGFGHEFTFKAIDVAEAKYKFMKKFGLLIDLKDPTVVFANRVQMDMTLQGIKVVTIEETIRKFD